MKGFPPRLSCSLQAGAWSLEAVKKEPGKKRLKIRRLKIAAYLSRLALRRSQGSTGYQVDEKYTRRAAWARHCTRSHLCVSGAHMQTLLSVRLDQLPPKVLAHRLAD